MNASRSLSGRYDSSRFAHSGKSFIEEHLRFQTPSVIRDRIAVIRVRGEERCRHLEHDDEQRRANQRREDVAKGLRHPRNCIVREQRLKREALLHASRRVAERRAEEILLRKLLRVPLAPSCASREQPERRADDQRRDEAVERAIRLHTNRLEEVRRRLAQVREHRRREDDLREAEDRQVADHHRRHRDPERIRTVERLARRIREQQRLHAELDGRHERRRIDARIRAEPRRDVLARRRFQMTARELVDRIARERQHERHVEAVRAKGQDAAIAEEQGLDEQRDTDRKSSRVRPEQDRDKRAAHRMARRAARQRHIEHHAEERQRRRNAQERQLLLRHMAPHLRDRHEPDRRHRRAQHRTRRWTQVVLWNMHEFISPINKRDNRCFHYTSSSWAA